MLMLTVTVHQDGTDIVVTGVTIEPRSNSMECSLWAVVGRESFDDGM